MTHLDPSVHVVLVGGPGIHICDGVEQQLCYPDALLPRKGGCNVEGGQGPQLQRKRGGAMRAQFKGSGPLPCEGSEGLSRVDAPCLPEMPIALHSCWCHLPAGQ